MSEAIPRFPRVLQQLCEMQSGLESGLDHALVAPRYFSSTFYMPRASSASPDRVRTESGLSPDCAKTRAFYKHFCTAAVRTRVRTPALRVSTFSFPLRFTYPCGLLGSGPSPDSVRTLPKPRVLQSFLDQGVQTLWDLLANPSQRGPSSLNQSIRGS